MLASLQAKLIILAVAGWTTRDAFCDAAAAEKVVQDLQRQIRARDEAAKGDQLRAANDLKEREQLEEQLRGLESKVSEGVCFGDSDVDNVRSLWLRRK
jgi:hypothetical protein